MADTIIKAIICQRIDTHENWNAIASAYVPKKGELVVFDDSTAEIENPQPTRFKIGNGVNVLSQLPFILQDVIDDYYAHKADASVHVSTDDRKYWNNKLGNKVNVENEVLEFTFDVSIES